MRRVLTGAFLAAVLSACSVEAPEYRPTPTPVASSTAVAKPDILSLTYEVDFTFTIDFAAQTGTITGQQAHVIIPGGGGVVLRNSGRLVEDVSQFPPPFLEEAGPHDYFDPGGVDQVCAALGA